MNNYTAVRNWTQLQANATGFDYGMAKGLLGEWVCWMLPKRKNRFGRDLQCEVVSCEVLTHCRPGHGPEVSNG